jgi:hypothetical protein
MPPFRPLMKVSYPSCCPISHQMNRLALKKERLHWEQAERERDEAEMQLRRVAELFQRMSSRGVNAKTDVKMDWEMLRETVRQT